MLRNLDGRVEVLVNVRDRAATEHMRFCLDAAFAEDTPAWELQPDDRWVRTGSRDSVDYQQQLMRLLVVRAE